jgi:hypothetical protein
MKNFAGYILIHRDLEHWHTMCLNIFRCQKNYNLSPEYTRTVMIKKIIAIALLSTFTHSCYAFERVENKDSVDLVSQQMVLATDSLSISTFDNFDTIQTVGFPAIKIFNNLDTIQTAGFPAIKIFNNLNTIQTAGFPAIKIFNNLDTIQTAGFPAIKILIKKATA